MYNANISWKPLMRVLNSMISQDLIMEIDVSSEGRKRDKRTSRLYEITMKGEQAIPHVHGFRRREGDDRPSPLNRDARGF